MAAHTAPRPRPVPVREPLVKPRPGARSGRASRAAAATQLALVVDDEPAVRNLIARLLTREGWTVQEEPDAASALAAAASRRPNLVVTDYEMPAISGLELAARLRALDAGLPIMMISGHPDAAAQILTLPGGHTGFAVKPFAPADLIARIDALVGRA